MNNHFELSVEEGARDFKVNNDIMGEAGRSSKCCVTKDPLKFLNSWLINWWTWTHTTYNILAVLKIPQRRRNLSKESSRRQPLCGTSRTVGLRQPRAGTALPSTPPLTPFPALDLGLYFQGDNSDKSSHLLPFNTSLFYSHNLPLAPP